jgi:hypothetical protein
VASVNPTGEPFGATARVEGLAAGRAARAARTGRPVNDYRSLVDELARNPAAVARLLAEHQPAEDGLCRACTRGGTGYRYVEWPCPVGAVALAARDTQASQEALPDPKSATPLRTSASPKRTDRLTPGEVIPLDAIAYERFGRGGH